MHSGSVNTVWINPPKYWAATADMNSDEKACLLERIEELAESGDTGALQQIDFVCLENPYLKWRHESKLNQLP
jgi:hypothetical protein